MAAKKVTTTKPATKTVAPKSAPSTKAAKPETVVVKVEVKAGSLNVPILSLAGATTGTLSLPKEIFGQKVNQPLLAQAVRVYSTNRKAHFGSTKTRGEISMTTKKWFRQKGTGNARHGAKSAPIFVGGGVAFGPKPRKTTLDLPKKMKKAALISALASKVELGEIVGLEGFEKATGKTKEMARLFKGLEKKSVLIVNDQSVTSAFRAIKNLPGVSFLTVDQLNAFEVISHQSLLMTKAAVERLQSGKSEITEDKQPENAKVKDLKPKTRRAK